MNRFSRLRTIRVSVRTDYTGGGLFEDASFTGETRTKLVFLDYADSCFQQFFPVRQS
jgi:hypothetical protein